MAFFTYLHVAVSTRLAELRRDGERGDSPVPTAVIIFGLVAAAAAVTALVASKASAWMNAIPGPSQP
ncbi:hypothetical protein [Micromonospora sagamiensis]|uniref:Uncharacterized protein n=1 Tax=Micromonospora sagamiensis TaxID=47875 RepID=A0A562WNX7_9ACTN|nr:hypothetical protein [Micromonospora sagamiensis]TWJ31841.1 hypothetical protein JD81_05403 [Micromonospora sagamiensis]BCL15105.1 hypothetical protein GCM10017556_28440 [Micromonospora sagamiensis]